MSFDKHSSLEKVDGVCETHEKAVVFPSPTYDGESLRLNREFEKKTLRKVDLRLIPVLALCYAMSLGDRNNLANAYVSGMATDLDIVKGVGYLVSTLVYFPPYILLELPATYLVRKVSPAIWMGTVVIVCGCLTLAMGFVKTWHQLAACRLILGFFRAGYFPAVSYLVSTWYIRYEVQQRISAFYAFAALFGGCSSIIAGGVSDLAGKGGLNGWQWIFIVFGAMTLFSGICALIFIVDFPEKNKFLSKEETNWVVQRLAEDRGDVEPDPWSRSKLINYALTPRLWSFAILFGCATMGAYAFSYYLTIILAGMGYSSRTSQFLVAPPYVWSLVATLGLARLSDKYRVRAPLMILQSVLAIVGLYLLAFHHDNGARYFGAFLAIGGVNGNVAATLGYMQNNVVGQCQRAYASAIVVGFGGIGGIVASIAFRSEDAPVYRHGLCVTIGANILTILICVINSLFFMWRNKQARSGTKLIEGRPGFYFTI